ncbi:MAG TPA: tetratricopeptide repeat protein [bacterium]|nr:tetratricopeptide repeat protein [bacterium]
MFTDTRGLELSTRSEEAARALSAVADHYAGFRADLADLVKAALAADPECAYAHVLRGYLMMLMGNTALVPAAQKALAGAEPLLGGATERERLHADALRAWIAGDVAGSTRILQGIVARWPLDLLALRMAHLFEFWQGDREALRDTVGGALTHWDEGAPGYHYLLGMRAFGLEECGDYAEAERAGRRGVELNPADHWATHAVAHVIEMQGRHRDGIAWLDGLKGHWGGANDFINHLWWHRSLYHLELEQFGAVLDIYDEHVRTGRLDFYLVMHNAASLLWRLELYGVDVGDRWQELAQFSADRVHDHANPFNDMHFTMALVAAGRADAVAEHLASLRDDACGRPGSWAPVFREVTLPLCEALAAFREGRHDAALAGIQRVRAQLHRAGGSHAQRDVVAETLIVAALQAGRADVARDLLAERTAAKPSSAWSWQRTAEALAALSDDAGAQAARERAAALLGAA